MNMDIDKLMGDNLKRIIKEKRISQRKLAGMINTSTSRLSAYVNGKSGIGKDVMSRICDALNIKPAELFFEEKEYFLTEDAMQFVAELQGYGPDAIQKCREMCRIMFGQPESPVPTWPEIDRRRDNHEV